MFHDSYNRKFEGTKGLSKKEDDHLQNLKKC